jgi:plastocyanin
MLSSEVRLRSILLFVLALALSLAACVRQPFGGRKVESFVCGDQTVGVDTVNGTSPKDVYICAGDTVTWLPNGNTFTVHFQKKYPFEGAPRDFANDPQKPNDPVKSPPAKYAGMLVVYHYDITVNGQPVPDPQLVGGGGH